MDSELCKQLLVTAKRCDNGEEVEGYLHFDQLTEGYYIIKSRTDLYADMLGEYFEIHASTVDYVYQRVA